MRVKAAFKMSEGMRMAKTSFTFFPTPDHNEREGRRLKFPCFARVSELAAVASERQTDFRP